MSQLRARKRGAARRADRARPGRCGAGRSWRALYHPGRRIGRRRSSRDSLVRHPLAAAARRVLEDPRRMGFPPWLAIMASIPLVNLILFYYVALSPWPREAALDRARGRPAPSEATRNSDNVCPAIRRASRGTNTLEDATMAGPNAPEPEHGRERPLSRGHLFRPQGRHDPRDDAGQVGRLDRSGARHRLRRPGADHDARPACCRCRSRSTPGTSPRPARASPTAPRSRSRRR